MEVDGSRSLKLALVLAFCYSGFRVDGTNSYMSFRWGSI